MADKRFQHGAETAARLRARTARVVDQCLTVLSRNLPAGRHSTDTGAGTSLTSTTGTGQNKVCRAMCCNISEDIKVGICEDVYYRTAATSRSVLLDRYYNPRSIWHGVYIIAFQQASL
ncbi:hypothetical protein IAQ61_006511 [Plenodomus lingam]|uniref:uncharacterized protein n=1 Tax=Leptosphaeria maculans TaxID=5022 RepID=UPI00331968ED|nr:hypothetical protein IAQ61_006511 [Plenodomus lingam]